MIKSAVFALMFCFILASSYAEAAVAPSCSMASKASSCCGPSSDCCDYKTPVPKPEAETFIGQLTQKPSDELLPVQLVQITTLPNQLPLHGFAPSLKSPPETLKLYQLHSSYRI